MRKKSFMLLGIGAVVVGLVVWGFIEGRKELALEQERERPVTVPPRVVVQDGGTAVVFDARTQKLADIGVVATAQTTRRGEAEALATVLSPQALIDLRNSYVAATAQAGKARATLEASHREYERLTVLHNDDRNISDRALQAAEATWHGDEAAQRATQAAVNAIEQSARQTWGAVLTAAVLGNASTFRRMSEQKDVLLRIAAPSGSRLLAPPGTANVIGDDGVLRASKLISPSPQADPRIQGPTFFYVAPAEGLLPGSTLTVRLPIGSPEVGVTIPAAAVLSWQGKAWYYVESAPGRFVRHELTDALPVAEGWFIPRSQAMRVVVRGAQTLLSEELRGEIKGGKED